MCVWGVCVSVGCVYVCVCVCVCVCASDCLHLNCHQFTSAMTSKLPSARPCCRDGQIDITCLRPLLRCIPRRLNVRRMKLPVPLQKKLVIEDKGLFKNVSCLYCKTICFCTPQTGPSSDFTHTHTHTHTPLQCL